MPSSIQIINDEKADWIDINAEKRLGRGGFGRVFAGTRRSDGERFAVKVVPRYKLDSAQTRARMYSEVSIGRTLVHPNIVGTLLSMEDRSNFYVVMELCDESLFEKLQAGPLPEPTVVRYTRDLLEGLAYLHDNLVIHRDVKAENLLIRDGRVKIGDFGLSARLKYADDRRHTSLGTASYVAPEILDERSLARGYSYEVDIWAVGVVVFAMLTGRLPFDGADEELTFQRIRNAKYRWPRRIAVSEEAKDFVSKILVIGQAERPSARDLLLLPFVTGLKLEITRPKQERPKTQRDFVTRVAVASPSRRADSEEPDSPEFVMVGPPEQGTRCYRDAQGRVRDPDGIMLGVPRSLRQAAPEVELGPRGSRAEEAERLEAVKSETERVRAEVAAAEGLRAEVAEAGRAKLVADEADRRAALPPATAPFAPFRPDWMRKVVACFADLTSRDEGIGFLLVDGTVSLKLGSAWIAQDPHETFVQFWEDPAGDPMTVPIELGVHAFGPMMSGLTRFSRTLKRRGVVRIEMPALPYSPSVPLVFIRDAYKTDNGWLFRASNGSVQANFDGPLRLKLFFDRKTREICFFSGYGPGAAVEIFRDDAVKAMGSATEIGRYRLLALDMNTECLANRGIDRLA
jgi:polo-like kinase 1